MIRAIAFIFSAFAAVAAASEYPERAIRVVVGMPPSSTFPVMVRAITSAVPDKSMTFVVDHRVGQGNLIAYQHAARAKPDGYTLVFMSTSVVINPFLHKDAGYRATVDFDPVLFIGMVDSGLLVHPSVPFASIRQLVRYAAQHPGKLTFGHNGDATQSYLGMMLLAQSSGAQFLPVPYSARGADAVVADLFTGTIDIHMPVMGRVKGHVSTGRVRLLATTGSERSELFPQVPTIGETYPGFESYVWYAIAAPKGTPEPIRRKLVTELAAGISGADAKRAISAIGVDRLVKTPEQAAKFIETEEKKWGKLLGNGHAK